MIENIRMVYFAAVSCYIASVFGETVVSEYPSGATVFNSGSMEGLSTETIVRIGNIKLSH
jgi:hypothetical protein